MVPSVIGSFCDCCALPAHYALKCTACTHDWEEPPIPVELLCPKCGTTLTVSASEHAAFARLLEPASPSVAPARRPESGVWGWSARLLSQAKRAG